MKKNYEMPLRRTGKPNLMKLGHDIKSVVVAIESAYLGLSEKPINRKSHDELFSLAKERATGIVDALLKRHEEDEKQDLKTEEK